MVSAFYLTLNLFKLEFEKIFCSNFVVMKILYAIQGTGNGHVSEQEKLFHPQKYGKLDILISGTQTDVNLDEEIKYQFKGFGFDFGTKVE